MGWPQERSTLPPWRASPTRSRSTKPRTTARQRKSGRIPSERLGSSSRSPRFASTRIPVLRMRAREVESFDDELDQLVQRLKAIMEGAYGAGLAATQVGVLRRVFVMRASEDGETLALVNPEVTAHGDELETDEEGCLSLQGLLGAGRAVDHRDGDGEGPSWRARHARARGLRRPSGPARARPSGRRAHDRPHDGRGPARGHGHAASRAGTRLPSLTWPRSGLPRRHRSAPTSSSGSQPGTRSLSA